MGITTSSIERQCQERADKIREDLYNRIAKFKRNHQEQIDSIPKEKKILIKDATGLRLSELMDDKKVTATEVMLTFIERTATIGVRNSYVIEEMFQEALEVAKKVDKAREEEPNKRSWRDGDKKEQTFPPFYGVPLSIKDSILYPGKISYMGHIDPINPIPHQQNEFMIMQKRMGFIPFVKTSSPQANKTMETNNNILGYAKNPWDQGRTCGGSSGGEGGLIGSHCSPTGIGSDIAGSSRIPSQFSGLLTLKPWYRFTNLCNASSGYYSGGLFLRTESTLMSRSIDDIILWNKYMFTKSNYANIPKRLQDPYLRLSPFRDAVFTDKKKYKIGYFNSFKGQVKCSPTHKRAVNQSLAILQKAGHYTQQINIDSAQKLVLMMVRLWFSDPNVDILNQLRKDERTIPEYVEVYKMAVIPTCIKQAIKPLIKARHPRLGALFEANLPFSSDQFFKMIYQLNSIKKQVYEYLQSQEIDLLICPGFFAPAFKHGQCNQLTYYIGFTMIWSMICYASGAVPITTVREDEQYFEDYFDDQFTKAANQAMQGAAGMPVGIQVVSYPGKEEEVLYVMKLIDDEIKFNQKNKSKAFYQEE